MDAPLFTNLLQEGHVLTADDRKAVDDACRQYPYCAPLQLMAWQGSTLMEEPADDTWRQRTELYLLDPRRLTQPLFRRVAPAATETDVLKEINAYQEISFKTAPKSVILSHFLEGANYEDHTEADTDVPSVEELGRKSVLRDDTICTETWAQILLAQGKREEAIAVYEQLMHKYPEKSTTFANRIAELKNQANN